MIGKKKLIFLLVILVLFAIIVHLGVIYLYRSDKYVFSTILQNIRNSTEGFLAEDVPPEAKIFNRTSSDEKKIAANPPSSSTTRKRYRIRDLTPEERQKEWKRRRERFCSFQSRVGNVNVHWPSERSSIHSLVDCSKPIEKKRILVYIHMNDPKRSEEAKKTWIKENEENQKSGLYEYLGIEVDVMTWGGKGLPCYYENMKREVEKLKCIIRYHIQEKSEYDYYFRLDDDCYLYVTNLAYLLSTLHVPADRTILTGFLFQSWQLWGGAGSFYNKNTLLFLDKQLETPPSCGKCHIDDWLTSYLLFQAGKRSETFHFYNGIWYGRPMEWYMNRAFNKNDITPPYNDYYDTFPDPLTFHYSFAPETKSYCTHQSYFGTAPFHPTISVLENFIRDGPAGKDTMQTEEYKQWKLSCKKAAHDLSLELDFFDFHAGTYEATAHKRGVTLDLYFEARADNFRNTGINGMLAKGGSELEGVHYKMLYYLTFMGGWVMNYIPEKSCADVLAEIKEAMKYKKENEDTELIYRLEEPDNDSSRVTFIGGSKCNVAAFWLASETIHNVIRKIPIIPFATSVKDQKKPFRFLDYVFEWK